MKYHTQKSTSLTWQPVPNTSGAYRRWLQLESSLTHRLQKTFGDFKVSNVSLQWNHPQPDEALLLKLRSNQTALIREVCLQSGDRPLVFARSVLPYASLNGCWHNLGRLGSRPLGAVLFADRKVSRTPFTFCKLAQHHPMSLRIKQTNLWARRSVFSRDGRKILVTEVFLPGVLSR